MTAAEDADTQAIRSLVRDHFAGMRWEPGTAADWETFAADFLEEASLFPAARPARRQTLEGFIARMKGVAQGSLRTFEEATLGMEVLAFGNVAVVLAASRMLENGTDVNHDVSGYLLVKSEGQWRIAAHAWDHASGEEALPASLRQE